MVKFKFSLITPYGTHVNTHYAKTAERAKETIEQWQAQLQGAGYKIKLESITDASNEKLPAGHTCW